MFILLLIFSICEGTEFNPLDTLKVHENSSFWENLSFGIGYEGGICYSGEDLAEPSSIPGLIAPFYWLNQIEGSIVYHTKNGNFWGICMGYGWQRLENRETLYMYIPPEEWGDSLTHGFIETSGNWDLSLYRLSIIYKFQKNVMNATFNLGKAVTKENLYEDMNYIESSKVERWCRGAGIGFSHFFSSGTFRPYIHLELGFAEEYKNNAPWKWDWDEKLWMSTSGLYLGFNLNFGGKN